MKISQKQANLLAKEVLRQLEKTRTGDVPETIISQIKKFREKREALKAECDRHGLILRNHENTWKNIVGTKNNDNIWYGNSMEEITKKLREREIPKLSAIEDEIILNAMFASDDDLQTFVNKIVKKFDKKTKNKILQN